METRKKRKKRSKKTQSSRFKIRVRYKYHYYRWIKTQDYGSFKEIYEKYKDKGYTFWCADLPPEFSSADGTWTGYRLDGDKTHTASTLKRYAQHKAWIDPVYKYEGKPVILVYNADEPSSSLDKLRPRPLTFPSPTAGLGGLEKA